MFLHSLGLAVPTRSFAQAEVLQALEVDPTFATLTEKSRHLLRKVLSGKTELSAATSLWTRFGRLSIFALTP